MEFGILFDLHVSNSFLVLINYLVLLFLNNREVVVTTPRRQIKRESRREEKAIKAAQLDKVTICCFWVLIFTCFTLVLRFS